MTVKVVTDSLSDITAELADSLGVTIVPLTVLFGREAFLDRVTISTEEFYHRLMTEDIVPTTTQPSPAAFADVYKKLAEDTDEILVITASSKLSGTYQSAIGAIDLLDGKSRIEVIDSQTVAMGHGLIVIAVAEAAQKGAGLDELIELANSALPRSHFAVYFDTLQYLARGGRIGRAQSLLGSMLSVKQILTIKEGEISPLTRRRSQAAGVDYMFEFVTGFRNIEALAVEQSTLPDVANRLTERLASQYPNVTIRRSVVSPVLGVHAGPNALAVTVLEGR